MSNCWKSHVAAQLIHAPHLLQLALPYLRKTKGNIINMCSMSGVVGQGNSTAYTPTKVTFGDNCIQIFIWGGISSDIRSEI